MLRAALGTAPGGSGSGRSRGGGSASASASVLQLPDLQHLLQQRNQLLQERRQERADMQVGADRTPDPDAPRQAACLLACLVRTKHGCAAAAAAPFLRRCPEPAPSSCLRCWAAGQVPPRQPGRTLRST